MTNPPDSSGTGVPRVMRHAAAGLPDGGFPYSATVTAGPLLVTAGIIAFLLGAAMLLRGGEQRSRLSLAWPLGAAAAVLVWGALGPHDPLAFIIGAAGLTVAAAASGAVISRRTPGKAHRPTSAARRGD